MTAQMCNQNDALISMLLGEQEERRQIDTARLQCTQERHITQPHIRDISQKLNMLEKTLMKRSHQQLPQDTTITRKYEQLNTINQRLRIALLKLNKKDNLEVQGMSTGVVQLYNATVGILTKQDKLSRQLSTLISQNQTLEGQIEQTKKEVQQNTSQLQRMAIVRDISLKRLGRLSQCLTR